MKKLKVLALSDLHLGEPEGLLYDKGVSILDVLVAKVDELSKGSDGVEDGIEELILIGDIADLSEANEVEAYTNTRVFLTALLKKVKVDKVIYIPGNHDHHLWAEMLNAHYDNIGYEKCTPKTGVTINRPRALMEKCLPSEYKGEVEAQYPFYQVNMAGSTFLFDHGHLFSSTLAWGVGFVSSLEEAEENTWEFMETIWFKGKTPLRVWFNNVREKFYDWSRRFSLRVKHPTRGVSFRADSTPVFDDDLRERIVRYLEKVVGLSEDATEDFHLVFGHTHHGGRVLKEDRKIRINGRFITIWNTGGWLVPSEVFSPDAFIFYIEQTQYGPRPQTYKLVAKEASEEGDYNRTILKERLKSIG